MDNRAITRAFYEGIWTEHRLELIDEIVHPDAVLHVWGLEKRGRDNLRTTVEQVWLPAFPDLADAELIRQLSA